MGKISILEHNGHLITVEYMHEYYVIDQSNPKIPIFYTAFFETQHYLISSPYTYNTVVWNNNSHKIYLKAGTQLDIYFDKNEVPVAGKDIQIGLILWKWLQLERICQ